MKLLYFSNLNCCSTPLYTSMHEPDNALTPTNSSSVTLTVNNDLIFYHDDPNRDCSQEEGAESGDGTIDIISHVSSSSS